MNLSVSAVSRTIARLEDELTQPLLERDNRTVRLTGAGREFREYAVQAVAQWQGMRRRLGNEGELVGEVSVFCSVTASYSVLAPILEHFRAAHPAVEIMLHTGDQADGVSRIVEGQDDIAVCGRPIQLSKRLAFLPLLESPLLFCAPTAACAVQEMVEAQGGDDIEDWSRLPLIVPERGVTKEAVDTWFVERGIRPRIYAQVAGHEAIVAMVGLGLGVGVAPKLVIDEAKMSSRVSPIMAQAKLPALSIGLCSLAQRSASPLVQAFWEAARQTYPAKQ